MYTKRIYSPWQLLKWTRVELLLFIVIAAVPVAVYDIGGQHWLHLPWLPIALVGTAVAFILGFQNNASYGRTWEARKIWGGIVNQSRTWGIQVLDFITNDFAEQPASEEELKEIKRELVMRHIAWMTALRHALRGPRPWERALDHRTNREWAELSQIHEHQIPIEEDLMPYLRDGECSFLCGKTNIPAQVIAMQSKRLRELRTRGLIEDFRHMAMADTLEELLTQQGKSERIKNFPYPRQYATLNAVFVWIFVLLLPFGVMNEFAKIGEGFAPVLPFAGRYFVWASIPFSVVVMWVFHTMERIGRITENPFEGTPNDVPITTMARGIEIDLREMLGEDPETIPKPIATKNGTQT